MTTAFFRVSPVSMKIREISSNCVIREEKAAKQRAKKNSAKKKFPDGILENRIGIHLKVNPSFPWAMISSTFSWAKFWPAKKEKTVGITAAAARREAMLLPNPSVAVVSSGFSFFRE